MSGRRRRVLMAMMAAGLMASRVLAATTQTAATCAALAGAAQPALELPLVQWHEASGTQPAHCELIGALDRRVGIDGRPYAIRFHLRLPAEWNRRLVFQGGSGTDGFLGNAGGDLLFDGYAMVATDSGHDDTVDTDPAAGGSTAFGADPQARIDYGYRALDRVTVTAKALIRTFYGRKTRRAYFIGCSNGGRQGMIAAERFPTYFDGIVAGAPGFNLPRASLAQAWNEQALAPLATQQSSNGQPYLADTFSDADLSLLAGAIRAACDALDGVVDDSVDAATDCTSARVHPQLDALQCPGAKSATCLSAAQITALKRIYAGPQLPDGTRLYPDWPWDPGVGGPLAFRAWLLGHMAADGQPRVNDALNLTLGGGILSMLFVTPPVVLPTTSFEQYIFNFDFVRDAPKIDAVAPPFEESAVSFMTATSVDRRAFRRRGGKLILYHGAADAVFSAHDTIDWYRRLSAASPGTPSFARLFLVPGLGHCLGGPGTTRFDALAAVIKWVEHGVAPKQIPAAAGPDAPWPTRTRPLCPYPLQAAYRGSGSVDEAASFRCRRPKPSAGLPD